MAKNKSNSINTLTPKIHLLERMHHGRVGRFGIVQKLWKDFSDDELAEYYITSSKKSIDKVLNGTLVNYVSPFDKPFPKLEENDNTEE